ncbi:hypothetical protein [Mammaliicoccus sciuri]|nr:hypothetical protein [Mammaliicoccus sciuri]WQL34249.1 hypothetical protein P3U41_05630 [Mammaliicoccus sciuri]WQL61188.1 hypothetical protein P3T96_05630 [Mammaliicoccus sciuri]
MENLKSKFHEKKDDIILTSGMFGLGIFIGACWLLQQAIYY